MALTSLLLQCGRYRLELARPVIMAILNLTRDSFSGDGLAGADLGVVIGRAEMALEAGAVILDVGAESTRPGAEPVPEDEEMVRLVPVVERLATLGVPVSVDTMKPRVMAAAIRAGASMINDVNAFQAEGAVGVVAGTDVGLCVMHMRGEPRTMQAAPRYGDVVSEVRDFLGERTGLLIAAGVDGQRICVDPGFGFGKTLDHNLELLRRLPEFRALGFPVLAGLSRKSMLGAITGRPVGERLQASVAAALLAVERGARILRVHDVAATRDALQVWEAVAPRP
jgi:dihydropteroate synthase